MNVYTIPATGMTTAEYMNYVSSLPWQFNADASLIINNPQVIVDGTLDLTNYPDILYAGVYTAPYVSRKIDKLTFLNRFTLAEMGTILSARTQDALLNAYMYKLESVQNVDLNDPDTVGGVQMLEQAGILASGRANQILGA